MKENLLDYTGLVLALVFLGVINFLLATCAVRIGEPHTVREGETLWQIARANEASLDRLLQVNNIEDPRQIMPGDRLIIPRHSGDPVPTVRDNKAEKTEGGMGSSDAPGDTASEHSTELSSTINSDPGSDLDTGVEFNPTWPCQGRLISRFEPGGDPTKNGILIQPPPEEPVKAAETGRVKMAGHWDSLPEFGKIVIIVHNEDFVTVYAHLSKTTVSEGQRVDRGNRIGIVGQSGAASKNLCYFEIRYDLKPRDPLLFLGEPG